MQNYNILSNLKVLSNKYSNFAVKVTAMYLKKLSATNFKNIKELRLEFSPKINCITGNNGSGKTNMLDAVYYLSVTKSYFAGHDSAVINHEEQAGSLIGEYVRDDSSMEEIALSMNRSGEKHLKRNGKAYNRMSDHIGLVPVVMVSPADSALINESGEERRRFLNTILSQTDREYLRRMQRYNNLLAARNKVLKNGEPAADLLETLGWQMSDAASYIYSKRSEFCKELEPVAAGYYRRISGGKESVGISYRSDLDSASLTDLLEESLDRDRMLRYTSTGIQRDDIVINMEGFSMRRFGSQGQQKSFLLALKLAQFEIMAGKYGRAPLLLLDDIFDKLDMQRVQFLLDLVAGDSFGQIFVTDSNKVRVSHLLEEVKGDNLSFEIESGRVV